ncbi:hypothetical protein AGMMS50267_03350 [Spirochaetia bacterium]|nr:hypothetical protein AGMMS50267_03350 [Spirochaetia bacterium]
MKKTPLFKQSPMIVVIATLLIIASFSLYSCKQDAIFYHIESGIKLKEATVKGTPTRIVEFNHTLYVGSDAIYEYDGAAHRWNSTGNPLEGKKVLGLAATTTRLYALIDAGTDLSSVALYRKSVGAGWELIHTGALNAMYGAGDILFTGYGNTVSYIDDTQTALSSSSALSGKGNLLGAVKFGGDYFISTQSGVFYASAGDIGAGTVFQIEETTTDAANPTTPLAGNFTGLIVIPDPAGDYLVMIASNGTLCKITGASPYSPVDTPNKWAKAFGFNGAVALWEGKVGGADVRYLLLGRSDYYGYLELGLDFAVDTPLTPGITIGNVDQYNSSLATHPVTSIHQAIDDETENGTTYRPIFAVTSLDGLWSCRYQLYENKDSWLMIWNQE